jgi:hypothetical protein
MQNSMNQAVAEQANVATNIDSQSVVDVIDFASLGAEPLLMSYSPEELINEFDKALNSISTAGTNLHNEAQVFEEKSRVRVIQGLGKILGIYIRFFKNVSADNNELLLNKLREKFGLNSNSKTTVFHMLSRLYRRNDTRQASGDAKVISLAFHAGQDESTFAAWVKANEGLDKIKKGAADRVKNLIENREVVPPMPRTAGEQKALFKKAEDAVWRLAKAKQGGKVFSIDKDLAPEMFEKLKPHDGKDWRVVVVNVVDDELLFHGFYSHRVNNSPDPVDHVNVDGTSDSEWPAFMIRSSEPDAPDYSNDTPENADKAAS